MTDPTHEQGFSLPLHPIPVVRLIVCDEENRVLILRRAPESFMPGVWCLPGGKVDYGDTVAETCAKELTEETGLVLSGLRFLFLQDSEPLAPGELQYLNLYFTCTASGPIQLNAESDAFAWVARPDLPQYDLAFRNDEALERYFTQ
jgi:8-oxo-dGTP pyrophosphatase MutT (NUDIX family)